MSEENKLPEPQWVTELKKWGIDVVAFREQWEESGDNAKNQFENALAKAQAEYKADKATLETKIGEAREDAEAFIQHLNTAWDEMVSNIQQTINVNSQEDDSAEEQA